MSVKNKRNQMYYFAFIHLLLFFLIYVRFFNLFFYWKIIALQNFAAFCQTSTRISHRYTYVSSLLHLPPISLPHAPPLGWYRAPVWVSWDIQQIPLAIYFTYDNVSFHVTLSIHPTLSSPLLMSINLIPLVFVCWDYLYLSFTFER